MRARNKLRILHLSDLHIGKESMSAWRMERVIGPAWLKNLQELAADEPIDLICFTGDLAQSGVAEQYEAATVFVNQLLTTLKVPRERFVCVPGNHDIDRTVFPNAWQEMRNGGFELNADAFSRWMAAANGKAPRGFDDALRDQVMARQAQYRGWLTSMGFSAMLPDAHHARLGYRIALDLGLAAPLHVIGLDSAWLAGDEHDAGKLRLTGEQIGLLLTENGKKLPGWSLALVHHPLGDLADGADSQRLLSEYGVGLLLHGHLHDADMVRWQTPSATLQVSSAGCLYQDDHFPNSFQILDVALPQGQVLQPQRIWARVWHRRGHWHDDNGAYPGSKDGRYSLVPDSPAKDEVNLPFTGGVFIGRESQLQQICAALLPTPVQQLKPTVVCCTVEGMAGVGKTRLAEEFVERHWLPAIGALPDADPASLYLRLVLPPPADEKPSAMALAQQLADRLRISGDASHLWPRLQATLQAGRQGLPLLVLIENVDSEAQADAVAELIHHLPGCPVLVTARYQRLGNANWARVAVAPMSAEEARNLLLAEVGEDGHGLTAAEADQLAMQLGYLPLALHIAASHLKLGLTPKAFLRALQNAGLDLKPAAQGDVRLSTDRARAIIRSSFELSWQHWQAGHGENPAWQQALVALAHGPATSTGISLSAAITALDKDDYPLFAVAAARLSLLQYQPKEQQSSIHPLIAEFLRSNPGLNAATVLGRMKDWLLQRLPETNDDRQQQAWGELWTESAALGHCLKLLTAEDALAVELAGQQFAIHVGPYGLWREFFARWIATDDQADQASRRWWVRSELAINTGALDEALACAKAKEQLDRAIGDERGVALALGHIADVLQARGELDEALRIRRDELLPIFDQLGDVRSRAVTMGKIADVLQARGELDEALRIRRDELLPIFDQLGDVRLRAVTMGKIANVLQARGELDEALRIRRDELLPIFDQLGDVRSRAVTMGKIADVLQARGELDEALRIRRDEEIPVYLKLGDVRSRAVTMGKIADVLQARGELDEALRIFRDEQLPIFDKLGDVRERAVSQTNIAICLTKRGKPEDGAEIAQLLQQAFSAAHRMRLPEAGQIAGFFKRIFGVEMPTS